MFTQRSEGGQREQQEDDTSKEETPKEKTPNGGCKENKTKGKEEQEKE